MYRPRSNPRFIFCTGGDQGVVMFESLRAPEYMIQLVQLLVRATRRHG